MSEDSKKYRAEMRTKAYKLANQSDEPVDASDWRRTADDLTAKKKVTIKQGPLEKCDSGPSNPREYADGGRVARKNGGRMPRKKRDDGGYNNQMGGSNASQQSGAKSSANYNNELGSQNYNNEMGKNKGGRVGRAMGGQNMPPAGIAAGEQIGNSVVPQAMLNPRAATQGSALGAGAGAAAALAAGAKRGGFKRAKGGSVAQDAKVSGTRPTGDRIAKASGGRTGKGKMNVNIIIAQKPEGAMGQGMPPGAPPPPMRPGMGPAPGTMPGAPGGAPMPPSPMPGGAPSGMPARPMGGGPNMPPQSMTGRKSGGRVDYPLDAGSGGGKGRMEKAKAYGP